MSFFSALKKVAKAHVKVGLAPFRAAKAVTKTSLRYSPNAIVVRKLHAAAKRAPTTPIQRSGGWMDSVARSAAAFAATRQAPTTAPAASWAGGGGAGGGGDDEDAFSPETEDDSQDGGGYGPAGDDAGDDADQELGAIDYEAYMDGGLAGWTDSLLNIGKGAVSGALSTGANLLQQQGQRPPVAPPPPPGMSMGAKVAIGAAVAFPLLYVLTRKRAAAPTPVAA
jgi:hypothetical protein